MAIPVSGTKPSAVYATVDLVRRYLPANAIAGTGETTPQDGIVLYSDVTSLIRKHSRIVDGKLGAMGFEWPFPDIAEVNPPPPELVIDAATFAIVAECRSILQYGNAKSGSIDHYDQKAKDIYDLLDATPNAMGYGLVTVTEDFGPEPIGTNLAEQFGPMYGNLFRLKNRNVYEDTLRFVNEDGDEVMKSTGVPFCQTEGDYRFHSQADGLVWLYTIDQMRSAVGAGGGIVYQFSWRKMDWGQSHATVMPGVSRI